MLDLVQVDALELAMLETDYLKLVAHLKTAREWGRAASDSNKALRIKNEDLKAELAGLKLGLKTKPGERVTLGDGRKVALVYFKKSGD